MNSIRVSAVIGLRSEESPTEEMGDSLQTGYICEGSASGPTGSSLWYDTSAGTDYGQGQRYETEETRYMSKVRSKNRLEN